MKAWHFLTADSRCAHGDLGEIKVGQTLTHDGGLAMCVSGLHASARLIDALDYAQGSVLCRVELGGEIIKGDDKMVAARRTVLWMGDVSTPLHLFACGEAERALKLVGVTDERLWNAVAVKRRWVQGKATEAELDAAQSAAGDAAGGAWTAAWYAARSAAQSAAWAAARDAAGDAARDAAWAAWDAARDAARGSQNRRLTDRIRRLM